MKGVAKGVRLDGRSPHEARRLCIVSADVPFASGSARASLGGSATNVLAVVKAELSACSVLGGGTIECAAHVHAGADSGAEIAAAVLRVFSAPGVVDLAALVVQPGVWAWRISIDLVVLLDDGSLLDTAVAAAHAALRNARVPALRVIKTEGGAELELDDDPGAAQMLPFALTLPAAVTLHLCGGRALVDATAAEAACAEGKVTVGVSPTGGVVFFAAEGKGIAPRELHEAILAAPKLAARIFAAITA